VALIVKRGGSIVVFVFVDVGLPIDLDVVEAKRGRTDCQTETAREPTRHIASCRLPLYVQDRALWRLDKQTDGR
jgi:hypothetical protein